MTWDSFIKSRWATWILMAILAFVMVLAARVFIAKYEVDSQISQLEAEAAKINKSNDQLTFLNQYMTTQDYQEEAAREKLNLKKDGEIVVGLPATNDSTDSANANSTQNESNFKQWYNYFFNNQ